MPDFTNDDVAKTVRLIRPDLLSDTTDAGQSGLRLIINGYRFFPSLVDQRSLANICEAFARPAISGKYADVLTWLPYELWLMRLDLQSLYNLSTESGQEDYLWWFFQCGVFEYRLTVFLTPAQDAYLFDPADRIAEADDEWVILPKLAYYIWMQRPDLQETFDLHEAAGVRRMVSWFYQFAFVDERLRATLTEERRRYLLASISVDDAPVVRLAYLLWQGSVRLKERFQSVASLEFNRWIEVEAQGSVPLFEFLSTAAEKEVNPGWPYAVVPRSEKKCGVNLVGYAQSDSGVAEDVRAAAKALVAVGVPFSIVDIDPGSAMCRNEDRSLSDFYDNSLPYNTTVFCVTAVEMLALAAKHGGVLFDADKVIGYWPWELSGWPEDWKTAFRFVDEVWASSSFIYQALIRCATVPVRLAPMVVSTYSSAGLGRHDLGMKQGVYYFVYAFDFLSTSTRKNPLAAVVAFRRAFSKGDLSVGLVIKAMRASLGGDVWKALQVEAEQDSRIILEDRTLGRGAVLDLYRACNCFISLHRSEGFGRGIAECMLLGKPVIATAYSGNLDFTSPGNAGLVDYSLVPVEREEYPHGEGQVWADPDIDQAVYWMRQVVNDPAVGQQLGVSGFQSVSSGYSPEAVGRRYVQLLNFQG